MKKFILSVSKSWKTCVECCGNAFETLALRRGELMERGAMIVTDERVFRLYGADLKFFLGGVPVFAMKAGERYKNEKTLFSLLRAMEEAGLGRQSVLIGLGGGVVGDVGGLAAGLYMRGVEFDLVPTTLLAQADAALGGKTAVDFCGVKNLIGGFFEPRKILIDGNFLSSLPGREIRSGLGEMVKHGALCPPLFEKMLSGSERLFDPSYLRELAFENLVYKASVVKRDPYEEKGLREALNLGHTTAHALEAELPFRHGECVLMGLVLEYRTARKYFPCDERFGACLTRLCELALGGRRWKVAESCLLEAAKRDKKNGEGKIRLVAPVAAGKYERLSLPFEEYRKSIGESAREA